MGGIALNKVAPSVMQAAVLRDPAITAGVGQFAVIQAVAPSLGLEVSAINVLAGAGPPNSALCLCCTKRPSQGQMSSMRPVQNIAAQSWCAEG